MHIVFVAVLIGFVVQFSGKLKMDLTPMLALLVATATVLSRSA
jgi:hypothetical protein